jgi:hypothetical protein
MISIICTSCRTELKIDDAFAGGVCRCQHCGTIQTVPTHLRNSARPAAPGTPLGSKTLYQNRANSDAGTGLDDIANAVATSSGLGSRRLRNPEVAVKTERKITPVAAPKKTSPLPLLIIGGVLLVALVIFGVIYLMHSQPNSTATSNPDNTPTPVPDAPQTATLGASFCGVPLPDPTVVYVLDRGSATEQFFDPLKAAVYRSLELIGPTRQFAIILTDNGSDKFAYPSIGMADASKEQTAKVRNLLDDAVASGASHFRSAVEQAVARRPAVIVFITAKWTITDDDAEVLKQNAQRGIRIATFMVGDSNATAPLEEASSRSGGVFRRISLADLQRFAQ